MKWESLRFEFPNGPFSGCLKLDKGKINLLIGTNGVGKSTFLRALRKRQEDLLAGFRVSFCHQHPLYPVGEITADNYVQALKELKTRNWRFEAEDFRSFGEMIGIYRHFDKPVKQLSGGENQSLKVFLALAEDCDLYVLDEPFNSLDLARTRILWMEIENLIARGKTFFITDHQLNHYEKKNASYHFLKQEENEIRLLDKSSSWQQAMSFIEGSS